MEKVIFVKVLEEYRLQVKFDDGVEGILDCSNKLYGSVFEPLKDPSYFAKVSIDEFGVIFWPNGADLATDAIHADLLSEQQKVAESSPPYSQ